jgi:acyl-CoA thioesterase I
MLSDLLKSAVISVGSLLLLSSCGGGSSDETSSPEIRYVALGASDATGIGASPLTEGYVYQIERGLKDNGRSVSLLNLGIPGAQADEIEDIEVPVALESDPDIVTIFTGGNDVVGGVSPETFQGDVRAILTELKAKTAAQIFIATLPDLTKLPRFQSRPDQDVTAGRVNVFNNIIREEAQAAGAVVVELASQVVENFDVSSDGFHPSNNGHRRIAEAFLEQILSKN